MIKVISQVALILLRISTVHVDNEVNVLAAFHPCVVTDL